MPGASPWLVSKKQSHRVPDERWGTEAEKDRNACVYEPEQDGDRVIAVIEGSAAILYSMSALNYTVEY